MSSMFEDTDIGAASHTEPPKPGRVRTFLRSAARLTFALSVAFLVLVAAIVAAIVGFEARDNARRQEEQRALEASLAPLRKAKSWPEDQIVGGARVSLQTKWGDDGVLVKMGVSDLPKGGFRVDNNARFILEFADGDGFKVLEHAIPVAEMTQMFEGGSVAAYQWQGAVASTAEQYRKSASYSALWAGVSVASTERAETAELWRDQSTWRRLRREMTNAQVRALLGEPTYVDAGPFTYWIYGGRDRSSSPYVTFYEGRVYGWNEP